MKNLEIDYSQYTITAKNREEFVNRTIEVVRESYLSNNTLIPSVFLLEGDTLHLILAPFTNDYQKGQLSYIINMMVDTMKIDGYAFASECWYSNKIDPDAESYFGKSIEGIDAKELVKKMEELIAKGIIPRPSEQAERKEGIAIMFQTKTQNCNVMLDNQANVVNKQFSKVDDTQSAQGGMFYVDPSKLRDIA